MDEIEIQELDPKKTYVALVPKDQMGHFTEMQFPKNVIAGFAKEVIEFQALSDLVDRLGYKLVEKSDPRFEGVEI